MKTLNILITGASGFIGKAMVETCSRIGNVFALDSILDPNSDKEIGLIKADITDKKILTDFFKYQKINVVVHCAGIAHQRVGKVDAKQYRQINCRATENLAEIACKANPDVHFIFLSSISVYGEKNGKGLVSEKESCHPTSDYAASKLAAEIGLKKQFEEGQLKRLDILRLAPVYDFDNSFNLDKRVLAPFKVAYIRFGSGAQKMSALSRQNLARFVLYRINQKMDLPSGFNGLYNICDEKPYTFNEIIHIFNTSVFKPSRPVLGFPLGIIKAFVRLAAFLYQSKEDWIYSCYDKLAQDLIFNNEQMLKTGYKPAQTLQSIFLNKESKS
ncbi:MAG: NAD(P)-dependent oxidoreductase [Desulfobacteraceae bacterium]|nr:NAD(P)-dependent oxidoreductase [Desulfobacteraceae bacterium]